MMNTTSGCFLFEALWLHAAAKAPAPMTKRDFDRETKVNYGAHMGNRTQYRRERGHDDRAFDWVAYRAARVAELRRLHGEPMPALDIGSPFRAGARHRAVTGRAMLLEGRAW